MGNYTVDGLTVTAREEREAWRLYYSMENGRLTWDGRPTWGDLTKSVRGAWVRWARQRLKASAPAAPCDGRVGSQTEPVDRSAHRLYCAAQAAGEQPAAAWENLTPSEQEHWRGVAERRLKAPRPHSHYYKDVRHLDYVDVYRVLQLFNVTDPCLQHAVKKLLVAGGRGGGKDITQDIKEAVASLTRWQAMREEDNRRAKVLSEGTASISPSVAENIDIGAVRRASERSNDLD